MGERTVTERRCDRPGCDQRITDKGMLDAGLSNRGVGSVVNFSSDDPEAPCPPDLCRECVESLRVWWTGKDRRRLGAEQRGETPTEPADPGSIPGTAPPGPATRKRGRAAAGSD